MKKIKLIFLVLIIIISSSEVLSFRALPSRLIAYFTFDVNGTDNSTQNNHLTKVGNINHTFGKLNNGTIFPSQNHYYRTEGDAGVPTNVLMPITGDETDSLTYAFWINLTTLSPPRTHKCIFNNARCGGGAPNTGGIRTEIDTEGTFTALFQKDGGAALVTASTTLTGLSDFHHFIIVLYKNIKLNLYIDVKLN